MLGNAIKLFNGDTIFAALRDKSFKVTAQPIDRTNDDSRNYREYDSRAAVSFLDIDAEGVGSLSEMRALGFGGEDIVLSDIAAVIPNIGLIRGEFIFTDYAEKSASDDIVIFTVSLKSSGKWSLNDALVRETNSECYFRTFYEDNMSNLQHIISSSTSFSAIRYSSNREVVSHSAFPGALPPNSKLPVAYDIFSYFIRPAIAGSSFILSSRIGFNTWLYVPDTASYGSVVAGAYTVVKSPDYPGVNIDAEVSLYIFKEGKENDESKFSDTDIGLSLIVEIKYTTPDSVVRINRHRVGYASENIHNLGDIPRSEWVMISLFFDGKNPKIFKNGKSYGDLVEIIDNGIELTTMQSRKDLNYIHRTSSGGLGVVYCVGPPVDFFLGLQPEKFQDYIQAKYFEDYF